jgi:hypothetical protein
MDRRSLLGTGAGAVAGALAGCSTLASGRPAVETNTGLDRDASAALDAESVFRTGDVGSLPEPPTTADSLSSAAVALATPDADAARLAEALRAGTAVALVGDGAPDAFRALLERVADTFHYGVESVHGRPHGPLVAVPRGETVETFWVVREGGWNDPVLDPVGWALDGRLPDCRTFVPDRAADSQYAPAGTAWVAGRLPSGETYAARTRAERYVGDGPAPSLRFRTTLHAAANGGYPVTEARRVADFANDRQLSDWFPNPHERGGVAVSNHSGPIDERLEVAFEPTTDRARAALTGCCGATVDGAVAYDHRTTWDWRRESLLASRGHHGGGTGRGTWHVRG